MIIDCFEIFIDRPSDLKARAQTYSSYKHHNIVKYLIGITPQGSVSFISEGWGGRVSDKHLTENSGLLNKLLPGDTVLADRGFDIKDCVGLSCATVTLPAFTRGKKQLSGIEVEQTRRIANIRIHVERVIGNLRQKYSFLSTTQPVDYLLCKPGENVATLDKIVTVCLSLTNLCNSVWEHTYYAMTSASGVISLVTVAIRHVGGQAYACVRAINLRPLASTKLRFNYIHSDATRIHSFVFHYYRRCRLEEKVRG